ncbi:hypothetical protein Q3G72_014822 [Acer saccharum]|nr:hypothetical protein Q3G72_014822 [Acer saccharum]
MNGKMLKDMIVHMRYRRPATLFRELIKKQKRTVEEGNHRESTYKSFVDAYVRDNVLLLHDVDSKVKKLEVDPRVKLLGAVGTLQAYMDHFWDVESEYENAKMK